MTVLPFPGRTTAGLEAVRQPAAPGGSPHIAGRFAAPGGGEGVFVGTYRLERLLDQYGQLAAAGVSTGELTGAGGERIGLASHRHTAAVEVVDGTHGHSASLGPVDVNLHGFLVTVDAFTLALPGSASTSTARHVRTARELLGLVTDTAVARDLSRAGPVEGR